MKQIIIEVRTNDYEYQDLSKEEIELNIIKEKLRVIEEMLDIEFEVIKTKYDWRNR